MPYMPAPIPPGATSPSAMSISVMAPPNGVSESWKQFTAPVEVTVVDAANSEQPGVPNRTSVPSIGAVRELRRDSGVPWISKKLIPPTAAAQMITIAASSA